MYETFDSRLYTIFAKLTIIFKSLKKKLIFLIENSKKIFLSHFL